MNMGVHEFEKEAIVVVYKTQTNIPCPRPWEQGMLLVSSPLGLKYTGYQRYAIR